MFTKEQKTHRKMDPTGENVAQRARPKPNKLGLGKITEKLRARAMCSRGPSYELILP
jgi:hypothetical protein